MTAATQTIELKKSGASQPMRPGYFSRLKAWDWIFAALVLGGLTYNYFLFQPYLDRYEIFVLLLTAPSWIALAWYWRPISYLSVVVAVLSLTAIWLYQVDGVGVYARAEEVFVLKFFLASQTAVLHMSLLLVASTVFYWVGLLAKKNGAGFEEVGAKIAWVAVTMGLVAFCVRWYETYLHNTGLGYIPVSNLYEVFIMFGWMTTLYILYYEDKYQTRKIGAFSMLVVSASVAFLLWYMVTREAHEIQPLIPALQSWWMKLHVPANFVSYGTWTIAAMLAFAYLLKQSTFKLSWLKLTPVWLLAGVFLLEPFLFGVYTLAPGQTNYAAAVGMSNFWAVYVGVAILIVGLIIMARDRFASKLPALEVLDDIMYKCIAIGLLFFTIATILGALWAAEAWGAYWSWDPKETWSLISWFTYAAWLHMRLVNGLRGTVAAYWAIAGFFITNFTFWGVNIFLSGLHSYGAL